MFDLNEIPDQPNQLPPDPPPDSSLPDAVSPADLHRGLPPLPFPRSRSRDAGDDVAAKALEPLSPQLSSHSSSLTLELLHSQLPKIRTAGETSLEHGSRVAVADLLGRTSGMGLSFPEDASTSGKRADSLDSESTIWNRRNFPSKKSSELRKHCDEGGEQDADVGATEGWFSLSVGGSSFRSPSRSAVDLMRCDSKALDATEHTVGRGKESPSPLASIKRSLRSPFWHGILLTHAAIKVPLDAFCVGDKAPDPILKKLPTTLNVQKLVKLDEVQKILLDGLVEQQVTRFRPSSGASAEEVEIFTSMMDAWTQQSKPSSILALDVGSQSPLAALISWDVLDYKFDVKFYIVSSTNLQILLKSRRSNMLLSPIKEEILDSGSLYGIVCCNTADLAAIDIDTIQTVDENEGKSTSFTKTGRSNAVLSHAFENERDMGVNSNSSFIASPSHNRNKRLQFLNKSASMETQRVSRIDADEIHEERGSKRKYQRQLSSLDIIQGGSKHGGSSLVYEEDVAVLRHDKFHGNYGRNSRRDEWRDDRLKDTIRDEWRGDRLKDTIRGNIEDRYSNRGRSREQQRHPYLEGQRGQKSKENEGYHDNLSWKKERDKATKSNISEEIKPISERKFVQSNISLSFHESESGKSGKKRDRKQESDDSLLLKRLRESEVSVLEPEQVNNACDDFRINSGDINSGSQSQKESRPIGKLVCTDLTINSRGLNERLEVNPLSSQMGSDGISKAKDEESHDMGIVKPLLNAMLEEKREPHRSSLSEAEGPTELDSSFQVSKMPAESNKVVEGLQRTEQAATLTQSSSVEADKEEPFLEFQVDVIDKETRTWLTSKQNALYLQEEFGVEAVINLESSNLNADMKADSQNSVLQVRVSMQTSELCDASEAKWFVDQAAAAVRSISTRGVFIKCLWYNGPVNMHSGDGAPSVQSVVKKIKGDDGKNLERIQDVTGVMIGVVLRKNGVVALHDTEPVSNRSFIGLRLKCVRKKGLLDALQTAEALLENVAEHFSKELEIYMANHVPDLPDSAQEHNDTVLNQDFPSTNAIYTKELLPNSPFKLNEENIEASTDSPNLDGVTRGELQETIQMKEEQEDLTETKELACRPLYVSNLPEHITPIKIRHIFDTVLREKLEGSTDLDNVSEFVVDVRYIPEKYCAFVELANDELLNASLKLYSEDKTVFHGLSVELGLSPNNKTERQSLFSRSGVRNRNGGEPTRAPFLGRSKSDSYVRKQFMALDNDSDSDFSHEWYGDYVSSKTNHVIDKPRPLFLSELMRNASAQTIKQLFEEIIATYLGPSLLVSSSKQLVLDVRYVPSRGCAFVDLATRQLVEFMLDLHSRRPEVFLNMKMELGRRPVDDDADRRLNLRNRDGTQGKSQPYGFRLASIGSRKKLEKRSSGSYRDYLEESDMADDLSRQTARSKKLRSDPEKTIYADRLPESASEGMIKKIFERVLLQTLTREELENFGDQLITEVRHVPSKYCAFVVFASEELTRVVLHMYNEDENAFESMRLKPHFHSRLEDLYKEDLHDVDDGLHASSFKERIPNLDTDARPRQTEIYDSRSSRSAVHRAITASAFKEVDRRRSVYVDRIPEDLSESTMTEMFEKSFRHKKHGHDGHMVSQVAYFRDKFDANKLCAFVELKTEEGTEELIDFYNANPDAFQGVRVRPGFKYSS